MIYLLDTNVLIAVLNGRSKAIVDRVKATDPGDVFVSAVTRAELLFGARRSSRPAVNVANVLALLAPYVSQPFDDDGAHHYAIVRADLAARGTPIGPNDLLLAATALAHDLTLVTHNTREFSRVVGLRIEDWES